MAKDGESDNTKKLKEVKKILSEVSQSEPVDCVALYDIIQAAQALYTEHCPGP